MPPPVERAVQTRSDRVNGASVFIRGRGESEYRGFDGAAEETLRRSFATNQRERYWDL